MPRRPVISSRAPEDDDQGEKLRRVRRRGEECSGEPRHRLNRHSVDFGKLEFRPSADRPRFHLYEDDRGSGVSADASGRIVQNGASGLGELQSPEIGAVVRCKLPSPPTR